MDNDLLLVIEKALEQITAESFYGAIVIFALLEQAFPRRKEFYSFQVRWLCNLSLLITEIFISRIAVPGGLIALAYWAEENNWGLFNQIEWPLLTVAFCSLIFLDLLAYGKHRLMHKVPLLWRLHMVHHADLEVDFTTTFRHHPLEICFSLLISAFVVIALGLAPLGILLFALLAPTVATLSHANIRWNTSLDRLLRKIIMTRDTHAVHHSSCKKETDSNYGLVFIWWDWLFSSYREEPDGGLDNYQIGLEHFRSPKDLSLARALSMPFNDLEEALPNKKDSGIRKSNPESEDLKKTIQGSH